MTVSDLARVDEWVRREHVARFWTPDTTAEQVIELYRERVTDRDPATHMLMASRDGEEVGFAQWYRWADYPEEALEVAARPGDVGIDFAIGEPDHVGGGVGTELVAALVEAARSRHPRAEVVAVPDAANLSSRRVLEKNGFALDDVRVVPSEGNDRPRALYRLAG